MFDLNYEPVWNRRAGETGEAYGAFLCFRDLPACDRTLEAAYLAYATPLGDAPPNSAPPVPDPWVTWSIRHEWDKRVRAWDRQLDRLKIEAAKHEAMEKGISWRAELQEDYIETMAIYKRARAALMAHAKDADFPERRTKTTRYSQEDKTWYTVVESTNPKALARLFELTRKMVFPNEDRSMPEDGHGHTLLHDREFFERRNGDPRLYSWKTMTQMVRDNIPVEPWACPDDGQLNSQ